MFNIGDKVRVKPNIECPMKPCHVCGHIGTIKDMSYGDYALITDCDMLVAFGQLELVERQSVIPLPLPG